MAGNSNKSETPKKAEKMKKKNVFSGIARTARDMKGEMKKVVWPNKKQIINNTVVVLAFIAISAILISGVDSVFSLLVKLLLKTA